MEYEQQLAAHKAGAEAKLRKVLDNVQRVKDTTLAQQQAQQRMLAEAQVALQQRLEDQEAEHRKEVGGLRRLCVFVVLCVYVLCASVCASMCVRACVRACVQACVRACRCCVACACVSVRVSVCVRVLCV